MKARIGDLVIEDVTVEDLKALLRAKGVPKARGYAPFPELGGNGAGKRPYVRHRKRRRKSRRPNSNKRWSFQEELKISKMRQQGLTDREIAKELGRTTKAVYWHRRLAKTLNPA